ncbi:helix-turn-helix transcriptional regulator [Pseudonocardia kujensis]|uniref:helix-turn-helix transcriptional regulator n=1 Tax=Pseudonocardia kujensis TaxID=1128675 RepID=UPI001E5607C4|nr:helix-turn-helix transcriptional regulator [Pseudonocardia kujensis]MCE0767678.1 helix-turn-helix transcriptional regulator [Pseudonocardia kujensis]
MDRTELGRTLRTWRERLRPADLGLPTGTRRRTPGLRREEVAQVAGISVDYLTRLEQGRGPHPSDAVLGALGRALRLSTDERDHLFALGGVRAPAPGTIPVEPRPSLLRLMDRLTDLPVLLLNARMDVLAWNAMAAALLGDLSAVPPAERNTAWRAFLGPGNRVVADDAERDRLDRALVSDLRGASARYPDDPGLRRLVATLEKGSERFAQMWAERTVRVRHGDRKKIRHPQLGDVTLDCDTLRDAFDDQMLLVYSAAPGTPEAEALALLRVIGIEADGTANGGADRRPEPISDGRAAPTDRLTNHPFQ